MFHVEMVITAKAQATLVVLKSADVRCCRQELSVTKGRNGANVSSSKSRLKSFASVNSFRWVTHPKNLDSLITSAVMTRIKINIFLSTK